MEISDDLAAALDLLVRRSSEAEARPGDRNAARRAIEQAVVVAALARGEGFGPSPADRTDA
jgi:hypothetical protein